MLAERRAAVERLASNAPVDPADLPADLAIGLELLRSVYELVASGALKLGHG